MREVGTKEPNVMRSHLAVSLTPTSCYLSSLLLQNKQRALASC